MLKPASSLCNLRCRYCFYADVSSHREAGSCGRMTEETAEAIFQEIERIGEEAEQKITLKLEEVKAQAKTSAEQLKKVVSFAQETRVATELAKENRNAAELSANRCEATAETIGALVHDAANLANEASASALAAENSETQAADCAAISIESAELAEQKAKEAAEAKEKSAQNAVSAKQSRDEAAEILNYTRQEVESVKGEHKKFAGALRGQASGKAITLSDVSPVEHEMEVKLSSDTITDFSGIKINVGGKNLFDVSKIINTEFITNNGDGHITIKSGSTSRPTGITLQELCPSLRVGDVVVLSAKNSTVGGSRIGVGSIWNFGDARTITATNLNTKVALYCDNSVSEHTISDIQIEYGEKPTVWERFVAPTQYSAKAEGIVEGIKSIYPSTSLSADTNGVTIGCEYNQDLNKTFDRLKKAIIALGGEV